MGKLGLVLMGRAMLSKYLTQFYIDGCGYVPSQVVWPEAKLSPQASTGEANGKPLHYSCLENPMNSIKR